MYQHRKNVDMKFKNGQNASISDREIADMPQLIARLTYWQDELDALDVTAMEGMIDSGLGRILIGITDTFIGLGNTFKTNVFKFLKDLKRSELKEYVESHALKVSSVEKLSFDQVMDMPIYAPYGMGVTYQSATSNIASVYDNLQAYSLSNIGLTAFTNIFKSFSRSDNKAGEQLNNLRKLVATSIAASSKFVDASDSDFAGTNQSRIPFKKCYASMAELISVKTTLLDYDKQLEDCGKIQANVSQMGDALNGTVELISSNEATVDKDFVSALGEVAMSMAKLMDAYSRVALRHSALEHNHVLNINTIYQLVASRKS